MSKGVIADDEVFSIDTMGQTLDEEFRVLCTENAEVGYFTLNAYSSSLEYKLGGRQIRSFPSGVDE